MVGGQTVNGQTVDRQATATDRQTTGVQWRRAVLFVLGWITYFAALAAAFPLGRMIGRAFPLTP